MIRIGETAKLSSKIFENKGSVPERLAFAKQLNRNFFEKICEQFTSKDISADVFEKTLKENAPQNINVSVKNYLQKGGLTINTFNAETNLVDGHDIYLNLNPLDKKIGLTDAEAFMHETFHFHSHISNPKHIAREIKMHELGLDKKTEEFYRSTLYNKSAFKKEEVEAKLQSMLDSLTREEQIEFLQNSRYRLTEEYNAFDEGAKYLDELQDRHPDLISEKIYGRDRDIYCFPEKIKIIVEKLKDIMKK